MVGKELRAALAGGGAQLLAVSGDLQRLSGIRAIKGVMLGEQGLCVLERGQEQRGRIMGEHRAASKPRR